MKDLYKEQIYRLEENLEQAESKENLLTKTKSHVEEDVNSTLSELKDLQTKLQSLDGMKRSPPQDKSLDIIILKKEVLFIKARLEAFLYRIRA